MAPSGSPERQQKLSELFRRVMKSRKLWQEPTEYYNDALQEMWEYCCHHLEEYDPTRAGVITWLDYHLKRNLRRFRDRKIREGRRQQTSYRTEDGQQLDPLDRVEAKADIQPCLEMWERTLQWVQADPKGILQNACFRRRPEINAQTLFLQRFPSETPWRNIAQQYALNPAEAKDLPKWYNRRCLPLVRQFAITQGWLP